MPAVEGVRRPLVLVAVIDPLEFDDLDRRAGRRIELFADRGVIGVVLVADEHHQRNGKA